MTLRKLIAHWYIWPWFPLIGLPLFWLLPREIALPIYLIASGWSILEFVAWWRAERHPIRSGPEALVGQPAHVVQCDPDGTGWVRLRGELWKAQFRKRVRPGDLVRVSAVARTTLIVE